MRFFASLVLGLLLLSGCSSLFRRPGPAPSLVVPAGEWAACKADEAEFAVRINYELREISGPAEQVVYFRRQKPPRLTEKQADGGETWEVEGGMVQWWSAISEGHTEAGKGIGSSVTIGFNSSKEGFTLTMDGNWDIPAKWDDSVSSEKMKKVWLFRQLTDTGIPVSAGPFHAKVSVQKI